MKNQKLQPTGRIKEDLVRRHGHCGLNTTAQSTLSTPKLDNGTATVVGRPHSAA